MPARNTLVENLGTSMTWGFSYPTTWPGQSSMGEKLKSYSDRYPKGKKSCAYCKNLKVKLQIEKGKIDFFDGYVSCKKGLLVREEVSHGELYEPEYPLHNDFWNRLKKGILHHEWRYANRCPEFIDMRE